MRGIIKQKYMINRKIITEARQIAKEFPILVLLGPRQSGKTTLAKMLFPEYRYVSFEDPDVREFVKNDPRSFLAEYDKHVIFDEIQRVPELFSYVQSHVDEINEEGMYVFTGSHNYLLMESISQSLSGRVGILTLLPLSIDEILSVNSHISIDEMIFQGGYPRIYDKNIRPQSFYASYLSTYVERDVKLLAKISCSDDFFRFLRILAGRSGQILNVLEISEQTGIPQKQVKEWISILKASYIVFDLPVYHKNYNKRLIKKPKIYFYDTGLLCYLLGIDDESQLINHYYRGAIYENFVIANLLKVKYNYAKNVDFYFWRDNHKKEVDLLIEKGTKLFACEIKSSGTFKEKFLDGLKYFNELSGKDVEGSYLLYSGMDMIQEEMNIVNIKNISTLLLDK